MQKRGGHSSVVVVLPLRSLASEFYTAASSTTQLVDNLTCICILPLLTLQDTV